MWAVGDDDGPSAAATRRNRPCVDPALPTRPVRCMQAAYGSAPRPRGEEQRRDEASRRSSFVTAKPV